jgi:hypothetical protein
MSRQSLSILTPSAVVTVWNGVSPHRFSPLREIIQVARANREATTGRRAKVPIFTAIAALSYLTAAKMVLVERTPDKSIRFLRVARPQPVNGLRSAAHMTEPATIRRVLGVITFVAKSVPDIARRTGLTDATVRRVIKLLYAHYLIIPRVRAGRSRPVRWMLCAMDHD